MDKGRVFRIARLFLCVSVSFSLLFCLSGCKPTDFFTEIIITPFSDVVDDTNEQKTVVNSPDADQESADLTALDWSLDAPSSEEVNNLVTYSSSPTTDLSAHHSIFSLAPVFWGIEASDGVRLMFGADSDLDEETPDATDYLDQMKSISFGNTTSSSDHTATSSQTSEASARASAQADSELSAEGASDAGVGDAVVSDEGNGIESGGENGGNQNGSGDESTQDRQDSGKTPLENQGYEGSVAVYNPGDALEKVPRADRLAVLGNDIATMVQAIGGRNSICAMTENAYFGSAQSIARACFRDIFSQSGDIDDDDFEQNRLLWESDGSDPDDLRSVEALVTCCGQGGVIFYDQHLGDQTTFFNDDQRRALWDADITLVPVDLSSVQGLIDAAAAIGDALSESTVCANDASDYATAYQNAVKSIIDGVVRTHGGTLAKEGSFENSGYLSENNFSYPYSYFSVFGTIATDIDYSLSTSAGGIDLSDGVLFARCDTTQTPLFYWMQSAGVYPNYVSDSSLGVDIKLLWPLNNDWYTSLSGSNGSAYAQWSAFESHPILNMTGEKLSTQETKTLKFGYGLGSDEVPYLIVSATETKPADEVRASVISSMSSPGQSRSGKLTLYAALPYYSGSGSGSGNTPMYSDIDTASTIGSTNAQTSESPFYTGLSASSVVRANPSGLLGSWTQSSMESVLEAVWLADLYSKYPEGCNYEPINDMSKFSATIKNQKCTTTKETVKTFYQVFYRLSDEMSEAYYESVVSDQLGDLKDL